MNDDDFTNGTGTTPPSVTITDVLAAVRELDKLSRGPVAVKLNPRDIERLQESMIGKATYAVTTTRCRSGAIMRLSGMPVYPDASVTEGMPRWVYRDEENGNGGT